MIPHMVRRGVVAAVAVGAATAVPTPAALAQSVEVERMVITGTRPEVPRPTLVVIEGTREHLEECWPAGYDVDGAPPVRLQVTFNSDGTIASPPVAMDPPPGVDKHDRVYVRAVTAARQSLYECEPYSFLPRNQYDHWREMVFVFRSAP